MFWYAVLHVFTQLRLLRPYMLICEKLIDLAVWNGDS
jgi:hypothetical protein